MADQYESSVVSELPGGLSMRHIVAAVLALFLFLLPAAAQTAELSKSVKQVVRVDAARVVLTHVRVIDGTGARQRRRIRM